MNKLVERNSFFDDFFNDIASGYFIRPLHGQSLPRAEQIKIDISDKESEYLICAEIPGVKKDEIKISLDGKNLTIAALIKQEDSLTKNNKVVCQERYYGKVSRQIQLGEEVDNTRIQANYNDGILTLVLPKNTVKKSHTIQIS